MDIPLIDDHKSQDFEKNWALYSRFCTEIILGGSQIVTQVSEIVICCMKLWWLGLQAVNIRKQQSDVIRPTQLKCVDYKL